MNATTQRSGRPKFTGITTYADPQGRFEFRHPWEWVRSTLDDDLDGVIVRPEDDDQATHFAVWVTALPVSVVADDLEDLKAGFDEGLRGLTDLTVEHSREDTYNNIVKVERTITFTEDGVRRKRRVWAMYADTWQYIVSFQGSTVDEFAYWLPMGNYCFTAFQLPLALWFATDPSTSEPADTEEAGLDAAGDRPTANGSTG